MIVVDLKQKKKRFLLYANLSLNNKVLRLLIFTGFKAKSLRISSSESDIVYWRLHFDKCHFNTLA